MWLSHETDRPLSVALSHYQYSILIILIWIVQERGFLKKTTETEISEFRLRFWLFPCTTPLLLAVVRGLLQQDYHHLQCQATDSWPALPEPVVVAAMSSSITTTNSLNFVHCSWLPRITSSHFVAAPTSQMHSLKKWETKKLIFWFFGILKWA